jgi:hypothetical protein
MAIIISLGVCHKTENMQPLLVRARALSILGAFLYTGVIVYLSVKIQFVPSVLPFSLIRPSRSASDMHNRQLLFALLVILLLFLPLSRVAFDRYYAYFLRSYI